MKGLRVWVVDLGCRDEGKVWDLRFAVQGLEFRVWSLRFGI